MKSLTKLVAVEAKLFVREPIGAFFALAFPAILLLVLGSAIPGFTEPDEALGGDRPIDIYLPITLALAIATVTMITLLGVLSQYRERGILRRLSTTPVSPTVLLAAQLVVNVGALVLGSLLAFLVATAVFQVAPPENVPGFGLAFVLGSAAMCAVALLIAAVAPSARASSGIGTLVYFPLMFFAGVWTPGPVMPDLVRRISDYTPLGAASQALQDSFAGAWPSALHVAVMTILTLGLGAVSARFFRWE
ncbi:ABC transporter permease [Solwaraspora sp. WMMD1047]|uniref:ABC transporter permease n=1 Tax=Solwaraspora sp. WMMD1047 TaxID=3016102 RepID=UPI002415D075|nr:ABC transporter permease [Solwaraspora sp. WMMD1047]MDG4830123.1 ABC transporter permease [Solwaraspora sp. WMMD1047]